MDDFNKLISNVNEGDYSTFYLLSGPEPYFIDKFEFFITDKLINDQNREFDYSVFYGKDVEISQIIESAKRFPMISPYNLVIVREAQNIKHSHDVLANYVLNPQKNTILIFCYKHKSFDKRSKLYKAANKNGVVYESRELYDSEIKKWLGFEINRGKLNIDHNSIEILHNSIGNDLSKIMKEIEKLKIILSEGTLITPETIEKHVGFSKKFNNFELYKALGDRNFSKCFQISNYLFNDSKSSTIIMTLGGMHNFYKRLMIYKSIENKSDAPKIMGVNPFFIKDYYYASKKYTMKQISKILEYILEADLKSKGVANRVINQKNILQDLLIKILK